MKKLIIVFTFFLSLPLLLFTGCVTVTETLYLREAVVTGPIVPSPIHLTDSIETPSVTLSPRFSYTSKNSFAGEIAQTTSYDVQDPVTHSEKSLTWNIATFNAGLDMDIALSNTFAISLGVNYSDQNEFSSFGGNFGIGLFSYSKENAFRFDVGLHINSMSYDAYTIRRVVTTNHFSGDSDVYLGFYNDVGESTHFDPYVNFTYNTAFKNWPLNLFLNAGYSIQTLFSFKPRTSYFALGHYTKTDKRGSSTAGFINVTPGIYFTIGESSRILLGTRFYIETQINEADPKLFIFPMVQFDFRM